MVLFAAVLLLAAAFDPGPSARSQYRYIPPDLRTAPDPALPDSAASIDRYVPGLRFAPPLDVSAVTIADLLSMSDGIESGGPVVIRTAYSGEFTPALLIELLADYGPSDEGRAFGTISRTTSSASLD
jgi:hypothetical protein